MSHLLSPTVLGDTIPLRNRICMGAMTRNRCVDNAKPTPATVKHYAERAADGVGLIVVEGTFIAPHGAEWPNAPMMFNEEHAEAWKKVTDAVHRVGGKVFFQPWHAGRIQNENMPMLKQHQLPVLAPSRVKAPGGKYRSLEGVPGHTENITEIQDPQALVEQYRRSVALAKKAGFDGVELLSQGGYLLHNFLCSHTNLRSDCYGGSVPNRCRFPLQVLDAIISVWGARRVGIKICPADDYNDTAVSYAELTETYTYYIAELMKRELGYVTLCRRGCVVRRTQTGDDFFMATPRPQGKELPDGYDPLTQFGGMINYPGSRTMLMVNHEYTPQEAEGLIQEGRIDLACFARPFIYNPDFVSRLKSGEAFAVNDRGGKVNYGPFETPDQDYNDWPRATPTATATA
ncbi:Aldolase-type TIM barrel [Aspergillus mulundensis]|uniref:Aldolase-type TIM barrel n=1 Tax=Aspergillus mulundensis TaxID=1810919 RepID=A0A3D8SCL0_9EURO|nr:Aldolase-type TIM barrel [Aspergillus mulundensis]RDW84087.1 Aldolase-type TIM barrel [Aspergillus mulundensis]